MDKTIKINLAGTLFTIDEDAYKILRDYLQAIDIRFRNMKGGNETIEDIEARIAEIFNSQKGIAGIVTRDNVESMISIIGKPEDFDTPEIQEEFEETTYRRKRLYRNPDDTVVAGVCGGIGAYLNTDPVLLRILFVIFTPFFAFGFFLYLILWVALPSANSETRRREMYGMDYAKVMAQQRHAAGYKTGSDPSYNKGYYQTSRIGNAINEVFRAIGRILFIIMRIFLIIVGSVILLTGFMILLTFVLVFIFKIPGAFSTNALDFNIVYLPDFLNYLVSPALYPWIIILAAIILILPLLGLIYWGVRMIFWFKANDGMLSLIMIIVWALSLTALVLLLFNEGVSFAENSKSSMKIPLSGSSDTIYVISAGSISDLITDKTLPFNTDGYSLLINDEKKELYVTPDLDIEYGDETSSGVTVRKKSFGSSEIIAFNRTKDLDYNFSVHGDSVLLDDYFTIPAGRRWSGDNIEIKITLPEGTIVKTDSGVERLCNCNNDYNEDRLYPLEKREGLSTWEMTEDGLVPLICRSKNLK
ncbi:MAG TPA: PspC domain-containing protein [Bacteroidales bacterium]|nr:PspC domain-containing protein [Bacteroidales bacterium]